MRIRQVIALWCAVIVCATVHASGHVTASREYDISGATVSVRTERDGADYSVLTIPGIHSYGKEGTPSLPYETLQMVVPTDASNFRIVAVSGSNIRNFKLLHRLIPAQPDFTTNQSREEEQFIAPLGMAYALSSPIATILSDGYIAGDIHVVTVGITPAKYSDSNLTLELYGKIDIEIDFDISNTTPMAISSEAGKKNELYRAFQSALGGSTSSTMKAGALTEETDPTHYYIIVPSKLESAVHKLSTWKMQKGYNVHVKTVESICGDIKYKIGTATYISGRTETIVDSAASVRAYLHHEFKKYGPYYCLLVGDYRTSMPIRRVRGEYGQNENGYWDIHYNETYTYCKNPCSDFFIPTDNYFSDLQSVWNLEKPEGLNIFIDDYNKDYYPDILVGRLLCSTLEEVLDYTDKLIIYESNPGLGDNSYLGKAMFAASDQFTDIAKEATKYYDPFGPDHTSVMVDSCINTSGVQHAFHLTGSNIIKAIGEHGFSSPIGHGSPATILMCRNPSKLQHIIADSNNPDEEPNLRPVSGDVSNGLNNLSNYYKPGIIYSYSCDNAPFDAYTTRGTISRNKVTNILENVDNGYRFDVHWNLAASYTNRSNIGGVAYIGNTRTGWLTEGKIYESQFFRSLKNCKKLGIVLALSKTKHMSSLWRNWFTRATCNLIGDPEVDMWTGKPKESVFDPSINDFTISGTVSADYSTYVLYNYSTLKVEKGNSCSFVRPVGDYILSVWTPDYLPFLRYYGTGGTLRTSHDAITKDALLGGDRGKEFVIGESGVLNLICTDNIACTGGITRIQNGGMANLHTMGNCSLGELTVEMGGKLNVEASGEIILNNCTIEAGTDVYLGH